MAERRHEGVHGLSWRQALLVLLVVLGMLGWVGVHAMQRLQLALDPPSAELSSPPVVEIVTLQPRSFVAWRRLPGSVAADREARLQSRITAQVTEAPHRSGDRVAADELLIRLDDEELVHERARLQAHRRSVEADLGAVRQQLRRREQLHADGMVSDETVDDLRSRVEGLEAALGENAQALRVLETRIGYTRIRAPYEGTVRAVHALPGDLAAPGQVLVELVDTSRLLVRFTLPERLLSDAYPGMPLRISVPATGETITATLDRLGPQLQGPGRGAPAEALLPATLRGVKPGMEAVVQLLMVQSDDALIVPAEAVHAGPGGAHVFIERNGQSHWRQIATGGEAGGLVMLVSGVSAGDRVITTPHPALANGAPVRVREAP